MLLLGLMRNTNFSGTESIRRASNTYSSIIYSMDGVVMPLLF